MENAIVTSSVDQGHRMADAEIKRQIADGGYDRELSLANMTDLSAETRNHDICCILAAYGDTGMTYGEIIEFYTMSLENTLNFGGYKSGRERNQ